MGLLDSQPCRVVLARRRQGVRSEPGIAFDASPAALSQAVARLPFELTRAQQRVLGEMSRIFPLGTFKEKKADAT